MAKYDLYWHICQQIKRRRKRNEENKENKS